MSAVKVSLNVVIVLSVYQPITGGNLLSESIALHSGQRVLTVPEFTEALPGEGGGGPRSLVGILKCFISAFCQGFTLLSEIERHMFVLVRRLSLFHLGAAAIFWPMSLVGIFPGEASLLQFEVETSTLP